MYRSIGTWVGAGCLTRCTVHNPQNHQILISIEHYEDYFRKLSGHGRREPIHRCRMKKETNPKDSCFPRRKLPISVMSCSVNSLLCS